MDVKQEPKTILEASLEAALEEQKQPLLDDQEKSSPNTTQKTHTQKAIRKTFKISAHLANLLPTGTVLAFQILTPVLTHQGSCTTYGSKLVTLIFIVMSALSCFLVCFTDSIRDDKGKVHHVVATFRGAWVIDGTIKFPREEASKYKIKFIDFFHGILSFAVFVAVVLFDQNVINCFQPNPTLQAKELLETLPIGVGVICSLLFVVFPTTRHGIGFPLSRK